MSYYNPHDSDPEHVFTESDYRRMADNVESWSPLSQKSVECRVQLAKSYGPNWACVLSGMGDQ